MTKQEERMALLNELIARRPDIDRIVSEYMDFLKLGEMAMDETETDVLEDIHFGIGSALGSLEDVWEKAYAFRQRLEDEKIMAEKGGR